MTIGGVRIPQKKKKKNFCQWIDYGNSKTSGYGGVSLLYQTRIHLVLGCEIRETIPWIKWEKYGVYILKL